MYNYSRLDGMSARLRPSMIRALVDTAPSLDRRGMIGTWLWEDFYAEDPANAMTPFRLANLTDGELAQCLAGVWPWMLQEYLDAGFQIPLPDEAIASLVTEGSATERLAAQSSVASRIDDANLV